MSKLIQWFLQLPWLLVVLVFAAACTPAQLAIVNDAQADRGLNDLTAEQATELYCAHGVAGAIAWLGDDWFDIIEAGDGIVPDCPKPEPVVVPIHERWPWKQLAWCESRGNWHINTNNGYYGGIQFSLTSWRGVGGTGYPHQHSPAEQIYRGQLLQSIQGWGAWPSCARQIGLL